MKQKWSLDELLDHWTLSSAEAALVARYRTDANKLGMALLLKYFQIAGRFPQRRRDVPSTCVSFVARQLRLPATAFTEYNWRGRTIKYHRATLRDFLGFRSGTVADAETVADWLIASVLPLEGRLEAVTEAVYERYRSLKVEPPTAGRIARLVRSAQRRYSEQFCAVIAAQLSAASKRALDALLERDVSADGVVAGQSPFAWLKRDADAVALKSILTEVEKLALIRQAALPASLFATLPPHVLHLYRERVSGERASEVRRHPATIRYTLLAAFCHLRGREITDNLLDLLIGIVKRIGRNAEKVIDRRVLRAFKRVRGKGRLLVSIAKASVAAPQGTVRDVIYPVADEDTLQRVIHEYETTDGYELALKRTARASYARHYRRMLAPLFSALVFRSDNAALQPLLQAVALIQDHLEATHTYYREEDVPVAGVVPAAWRDLVLVTNKSGRQRINRISYELCVCERLREQLRCRAVWVAGADRYRNPDEDLPADFQSRRDDYYAALQQPQEAAAFTARLRQEMVDAMDTLHDGLAGNAWLTLVDGRKHPLKLSPLPAQVEPPTLAALTRELQQRWPMTPLLDMLKEVDLRVHFSDNFQTSAVRETLSTTTLRKRLLLCLYALGTNTGYERVGAATSGDALRYVRRRFINKANLRAAIATVVDAIFAARLPHIWGEATTACASDSKKFAAWDQNLLTEWHVRYRGPGIMVYWHIDKKAACIYSQVKRCSSSEVAAMIEGVLHHCTQMAVDKNYVDTHGQSSVAFAFCRLLGFQLLPRLKPMKRQKLNQPYAGADETFANLKPILTRPIRWSLIEQHYDEMIRYATALRLGTADAEAILQRFTRYGVQHPTYKALVELGKAVKTLFLCQYLHSLELRREIHEGLNVVETWNSANSFIFYGRNGEIATNNRQAQEVSVLALHLLQMCMVYVNTLMIQRVLLQSEWMNRMEPEDLRALTPLLYKHVNPYGRFDLDMAKRLPLD